MLGIMVFAIFVCERAKGNRIETAAEVQEIRTLQQEARNAVSGKSVHTSAASVLLEDAFAPSVHSIPVQTKLHGYASQEDTNNMWNKEDFFLKATSEQLKKECARRSLQVTGTKAQRIERLRKAAAVIAEEELIAGEEWSDLPPPLSAEEIDALDTVAAIKDALRSRGLKLSGGREELRQRLKDSLMGSTVSYPLGSIVNLVYHAGSREGQPRRVKVIAYRDTAGEPGIEVQELDLASRHVSFYRLSLCDPGEDLIITKDSIYVKATADQLKKECARRSLEVTGTTAQLIERLRNAAAGIAEEETLD